MYTNFQWVHLREETSRNLGVHASIILKQVLLSNKMGWPVMD